tara:strand:- start:39 stop:572 length:534 start_codon:yes stop_codon:yes gene_type:complete
MNFCPKCSSAEIVKKIPEGDNRERDVCNKCEEIFYTNPNIVTGVLAYTDNDELILCKRSIEPRHGFWTLPAGFLENQESIEEGALRETEEEAKLQVSDVKLFTVLSVPHIDQIYTFFTGKVVNHDFGPTPESSEVKLFKYDDIPWAELAFPTVIKTIKLFLEHGDDKVFNEVLRPKL